MSGIEIAGLVLGAFPILCESARTLRGVFGDLGSWWRFKHEFEDFIAHLETEHVAFSQMIDILLEPLDAISDDDREALRTDSNSPLWFDLHVQKELGYRVQPKYLDPFMRQLQGINDVLNELHSMLPINKVFPQKQSFY